MRELDCRESEEDEEQEVKSIIEIAWDRFRERAAECGYRGLPEILDDTDPWFFHAFIAAIDSAVGTGVQS